MSATIIIPDRSLEQRMAALNHANEVRSARAALKADLRKGRVSLVDVLSDPPECVLTAKVLDLLVAVPRVGQVRGLAILNRCRVLPTKAVGRMTARQRAELSMVLRTRGVR